MRSTYSNKIIVAMLAAGCSVLKVVVTAEECQVDSYMEPRVDRYAGILPLDVCQELIKLGEQTGFNEIHESIDEYQSDKQKKPSQSIEVYSYIRNGDHRIIDHPIWEVLQPYIDVFADLVKKSRKEEEHKILFPDEPNRDPKLDWIFFRKYSPSSERNSLVTHVDTNVHTLNIALNDDFVGGGLFYVKPPMQEIKSSDGRPDLHPYMNKYDWANTVKRGNTSDLVFPDMKAGDVLIHNFTVWHGVAPLEKGERYSFVLFYDMDNPILSDLDDPDEIFVEFYHEIEDVKVVLVYVEEQAQGKVTLDTMIDPFVPFVAHQLGSFEGHKFRVMVKDTDEVLAEFVVRRDREQQRYEVLKKGNDSHDEL